VMVKWLSYFREGIKKGSFEFPKENTKESSNQI
jgi:hypothetical protein